MDRKELPKPDVEKGRQDNYAAPRTEVERTIAEIWQQALKIENVGIHDNFFDLGGQSLLMARVKNSLQKFLKKEIPMIALFQYPSIDSLCKYLCSDENKQPSFQRVNERAKRQANAMIRQKQLRAVRGRSNE